MDLSHPLDALMRERIKAAKPNQADFAKAIGRSAGWLNKYMHGAGNATIDDVVRMLALLIGVETKPLSALERRLLKALDGVNVERREDAVVAMEAVSKAYSRAPRQELTGRTTDTRPEGARTARGKR